VAYEDTRGGSFTGFAACRGRNATSLKGQHRIHDVLPQPEQDISQRFVDLGGIAALLQARNSPSQGPCQVNSIQPVEPRQIGTRELKDGRFGVLGQENDGITPGGGDVNDHNWASVGGLRQHVKRWRFQKVLVPRELSDRLERGFPGQRHAVRGLEKSVNIVEPRIRPEPVHHPGPERRLF
jgi:hypothetical protein